MTATDGDRGGATTDGPLLAVLDYGIGNLRSAQKALQHVGAQAHLTADPGLIEQADGVVLPGVGNFGACMNALVDTGLADQARKVAERGQPFIGICVGMQMLFDGSEESPGIPGLGLLPGWVRWLPDTVKRPQMQWNQLETVDHPLMAGLSGAWVYFVHSLAPVAEADTTGNDGDSADDAAANDSAAEAAANDIVIATTDYGGPVMAAAARNNIYATQFHPEKSAKTGLRLLSNFVSMCANPAGSGVGS